jgi:segregation and condensation protein A
MKERCAGELVLDLDGFEGPIDLLLTLARDQKVDLRRISILALAEQYLAFILEADRLELEIAADYLVMAAWLAFLKSRLLLPEDEVPEDEPSALDMAEALAFRLRRLEAMQEAGKGLMRRPLLDRDVFAAGAPAGLEDRVRPVFEASLYDLLAAYGRQKSRGGAEVLQIRAPQYYSVEDAIQRLSSLLGTVVEWRHLSQFLPPQLGGSLGGDRGLAATFGATLELARTGRIELRQDAPFGPIWLRSARPHS